MKIIIFLAKILLKCYFRISKNLNVIIKKIIYRLYIFLSYLLIRVKFYIIIIYLITNEKSKTSILKLFLAIFLIGFCIPTSYAGIEAVIEALDGILKRGEKVTIIIIDMEEDFFSRFLQRRS